MKWLNATFNTFLFQLIWIECVEMLFWVQAHTLRQSQMLKVIIILVLCDNCTNVTLITPLQDETKIQNI